MDERWIDVEVEHDDGQWYRGQVLHTYRDRGRWRAVVIYTVGLLRYYRGVDQAQVRRLHQGPAGLG